MSFLVRRNNPHMVYNAAKSIVGHRMYGRFPRHHENSTIDHADSVCRAHDYTMDYIKNKSRNNTEPDRKTSDPHSLKKNLHPFLRHSLNDEFKSHNAKYRWSEFRRKMIYGNFAM